jgi:hypothetical protein
LGIAGLRQPPGKEITLLDAVSTRRNRKWSFGLLIVCGLLAIAAAVAGINDNPPGILLAFLAATALILAFVHSWRTARKFLLLLLVSVFGFVLFIILNVIFDSIVQNPATPAPLKDLIQSPAIETLSLAIAMICAAALIIGIVGSVVIFIRGRDRTT